MTNHTHPSRGAPDAVTFCGTVNCTWKSVHVEVVPVACVFGWMQTNSLLRQVSRMQYPESQSVLAAHLVPTSPVAFIGASGSPSFTSGAGVKQRMVTKCCNKNCIENIKDENRVAFTARIERMGEFEKCTFITGLLQGIRFRLANRNRYQYYIYTLGFLCRPAFCSLVDINATTLDQLNTYMDEAREDITLCRNAMRVMASQYEAKRLVDGWLVLTKQHYNAMRREYTTPDGRRVGPIEFLRLAQGAGVRPDDAK